jgi:hypothetical protein
MVRQGVGVAVLVVALSGCGSSDRDKVVAALKQLGSAAKRRDGAKLCSEVLHANTVRAVERLDAAYMPPGSGPPSCARRMSGASGNPRDVPLRDLTADDVTINGDVAYASDDSERVPFARRVGNGWKVDFTAQPTFAWRVRTSLACVHWQDRLQALPLPPANRAGIIDQLRSAGAAATAFHEQIGAIDAPQDVQTAAGYLEDALARLDARLEAMAAALGRGRSLDDIWKHSAPAIARASSDVMRAANAADIGCGRLPNVAPDGAQFRRQADARCAPAVAAIKRIGDPGDSLVAIRRALNRAASAMRRAKRDLAGLTPPADLDRVYRATLTTLARLGATLRLEGSAAVRRDRGAAQRAAAHLGPLNFRKVTGFLRLGLPTCAEL